MQYISTTLSKSIFLLFLPVHLFLAQHASAARADYDVDDDGLIEINTLAELDQLRSESLSAPVTLDGVSTGCDPCIGFELMADLDFDTDDSGAVDDADEYWNAGQGWLPIGVLDAVFEGNGNAIRNLFIDRISPTVGLFDELGPNAEVRGLSLVDVSVTGAPDGIGASLSVGALAASAIGSTVEGVSVNGSVIATAGEPALVRVGGLVGGAYATEGAITISSCQFSGSVSGGNVNADVVRVGGLAGTGDSLVVSDSSATVSFQATGSDVSSGGLVGVIAGGLAFGTSNARIARSHATIVAGETNGDSGAFSGGLASVPGPPRGNVHVEDSFAAGTLDVTVPQSSLISAGGLLNALDSGSTVSRSYARVSLVAATSGDFATIYTGGIVGQSRGGVVSDSYYLSDTSNGVDAMTEAQLTCPVQPADPDCPLPVFGAWSSTIWDFGNASQYPILKVDGQSVRDTDEDGVIDEDDAFPENAAASVDVDDDGLPDAWNDSCDISCQEDSGLFLDPSVTSGGSLAGSSGSSGGALHWLALLVLFCMGRRMSHRNRT